MAIYLNGETVVGTNTIDTTATYDNLVLVYTNTADVGTITLDSGIKAVADILLVGGGGAGGSAGGTGNNVGAGGGGGAGGFLLQREYTLNSGDYTVNVGTGGVASAAASTLPGGNGSSSLFKSGGTTLLEAFGGGGGGAQSVGNPGASGGGGSRYYVSSTDNHACDGGAYTNGMGNAGGAGNTGRTAGGGGGASEAGSPGSTANIGGAGGAGRESNITGTLVTYAGGGGGGTRAASKEENLGAGGAGGGGAGSGNASFPPVAGTNGLGGGGGGGSLTVAGANGGSGVVIVRITLALETAVPVPTVPDVVYTGENIVAFKPKIGYLVVGGDTNATNVGEYNFDVKPADGFTWLDGTSDPTNIVWHITKKAIDFPTIATELAYTGALQTGVTYPEEYDQFCEFSDDSVIKAVNACTYRFIVSLVEEDNTMWEDGSIAAITNYWTISPVAVEKPTSVGGLIYSGTNSIVFTEYEGVVYKAGVTNSVNAGSFHYTVALDNPVGYTNYIWTGESGDASVANVRVDWEIASQLVDVPVAQTGLIYNGESQNAFESLDWVHYSLVTGSTTNETAGGSYEAVFHLSGNDEAENFVWKVGETSSNYTVPWSIGADTNEIPELKLVGWRIGAEAKTPTISAKWGADTVEYSYGFGDDAESVTSWTNDTDAITAPGTWVLRAVIPETLSWTAATNTTTFLMWDDPGVLFHNCIEIFVKGTTNELSNFVVPIRISEDSMQGFYYDEASPTNLVFVDDFGNLLSYDVDTWNKSGESVVWVKLVTLPMAGMPVTMYWNLREGQVAPENISTNVWSDYIGVWHLSEASGGLATVKDASGHQDGTGHASSLVSDGKFGKARGRNVRGPKGPAATVPEYSELNELASGPFSISGWVKFPNIATASVSWGYLFARKDNDNYAGWAAQFCGKAGGNGALDGIRFFSGGGTGERYIFDTTGKFAADDWVKYDFVYSGSSVSLYLNGISIGTAAVGAAVKNGAGQPFTIGGINKEVSSGSESGIASTINGYSDEVRLMPAAIDSTHIAADYKYQSDPTMSTNGIVYLDGLKVDYWVVEPEMDKTTWDVTDTVKGQITNYGQLRYGTVTNYTYSVYDESETYNTPDAITNAGNYRVVFTQVDTNGYQRIEKVFEIRVTKSKPYSDIVGNGGDSGRVLLMNNHTGESGVPNIDYQGWYDADNAGAKSSSTATYWHHVNLTAPAVSTFNLQNGTESILYTFDGRRLWHLENCRHGNTFPTSTGTDLSSTQNYLPYRATYSRRINEHRATQRATTRSTVGQLVMLNTTDAVVYSPCYTNGIGTIYFDAVNGWCRNSEDYNNYKIDVQYATNTTDNLAPTDANCVKIETYSVGEGESSYYVVVTNDNEEVSTNYYVTVTNDYGKLEGCWHAAEMSPFMRDTVDGSGTFDKLDSTTNLALAVTHGGTMGNFYRVVAPIDIWGPVRFRIKRTTCTSHDTDFGVDEGGFILLDNIIASVPAMGGSLETLGHFDESKTGHEILGWELATSVPYPSIYDGEIYGGAKPSFFINAGDGTTWNTNDFFQSATMHYRWRYLNQTAGPWSTIELNPYNGFKAMSKFELPGRACDVEYWYDYRLQAPYYEYVDYSGIGKQIDYTEERGMQTNRLSGTTFASAGTDWFFRVREGKSDYSGLDIVFRRGASAAPERIHMMAVGNHVWRGFVQTKENQAGEISYRIEALDEQTAEFAEYAATTNYWCCKTDNPRFPVSDSLEPGTADSWSTLTLDAVTGYVMFQIEDKSKDSMSLTVVHADYQDVNAWSDALGCKIPGHSESIFVGTSTTNAYKIGVSPKKQKFTDDFSGWGNMAATNEAWTFPVSLFTDINHLYGGKAYQTFTAETNGFWDVGQGMWVAKKYMVATNNAGVALQMEGNGKGYFQFYDEAKAPRGLESISFNARLGQFVRFDDFAYYYAGNMLTLSNYTFMARTAFDLDSNNGFDGNASLSLVANYLPNKGAYEARWEWIGGKTKSTDKGGQRLCLYRWNVTPSGAKSAELIVARTNLTGKTNNPFDISGLTALENSSSQSFLPMFISVSNAVDRTFVVAAVRRSGATLGTSPLKDGSGYSISDDKYKWFGVCFCDTTSKRLTRGSYGVLSANCDGVFARPEFSHTVQHVSNLTTDSFERQQLAQIDNLQDIKNCAEDDLQDAEYPGWNIIPGRLTNVWTSATVNAVMSAPLEQYLQVYLGTAGRTDWGTTPYTNIALKSFGGSGFTLPFYTTKDCSVKFAVAGTIEDVRTDVVIDSVVMKQWRGGDWNGEDVKNEKGVAPSWTKAGSSEMSPIYTNFVFTSCWTTNQNILMSAKRSNFETPCAIRSPIMDGKANNGFGGDGYVRGIGLGMISFKYKDAQENAVLLLQIATNRVDYMSADTFDRSFSDSVWTTIATNDFSKMTAQQRSSGLISTYLGLHSVTGMMRIVVSTNAIAAVANETNPQRFGDVTITEISCIDEPPVDVHSWWGWNMRTVGGDADTERRMLLSDYSTSAGGSGLSLALNNSVSANFNESLIDVDDRESYIQHKPFVQTPTFTSNIVGEVVFKARKYASTDPHATVTMYGSPNATENDDGTWERIPGAVFMVTNAWYETYSCKMDPRYKAFRLAVAGVEDIVEGTSGGGNGLPDGAYDPPPRVLIDEMFVSEAVNAIMGFKNVGCFRHNLSATTEQPNVPSAGEQPICEEQWGVQCEIYGAQLASDIDFSREPRVYLHWYDGVYPWGYENWKNNNAARSARLSRATDTAEDRFVYRSSMRLSPDAVVPMATFAPTYVQYTLEVVYYTKENPLVASTNWLTSADWKVPEWYRPLDLNAENARSGGFAAYNIIDNVAPGWAWINEVNVFGLFQNYYNTDDDCQFVEIAHPPEADMSGWTVRLLEPSEGNNLVITNVLAKFGSGGLAGTKQISPEDASYNMVFRVIANEGARRSGRLKVSDGTLDAVWNVDNPTQVFTSDGVIGYYDPVVYQLVRTSGIVEHEIMLEGTNFLESLEIEPPDYLYRMRDFVTNRVANSVIILPGYDYGGASNSLGVVRNSGHNGMEEPENDWTHTAKMTPGHHNIGQVIDPNHPVPSGEEVLVYLTVAGDHILQSLDGSNFTNGMFTTIVTKGNPVGTNVIYQVDPWYVLGSVTTGNVSIIGQATQTSSTQPYTYNLEHVAQGISNNVTVVASAALNPKFATEWGIPENDPYRNAIIAWLEGGTDLYGNRFAKVEEGEIQLAKFRALSGNVVTNLTLKEMYWLDMDPTIGNLSLIGGMKEAPTGVPREMTLDDGVTTTTLTNRRMTVYMMISNENAVVEAPANPRGIHDFTRYWTPYALRGLEPGEESRGYVSSTGKWNSVTFKIAGLLLNGHTSFNDVDSKVPLRHFVFNPASFDADGLSRIEVYDPHSPLSLGYNAGWWRWWEEQSAKGEPLSIIVFFWMIDTRQPPLGIEQLKETNYYGE